MYVYSNKIICYVFITGEGGNIAYTVNWLPSRYPFIAGYSILGICLLVIALLLLVTRYR